jgi:hypothetical protein
VCGRTFATAAVFGWVALAFGADNTAISAAEAVKKVGKTVRVEMVVKKAKDRLEKRGLVYLDSEDDFHSPANLGVTITPGAAKEYRAKGIADPAAYFQGKTIRVRGEILVFETRPYLPVTDPAQIEVLPQKK